MTDKPENPQAFPVTGSVAHNSEWDTTEGMTLHDYFISHCPLTYSEAWRIWTSTRDFSGLTSGTERGLFLMFYAELRCDYADAMLKARAE